MRPFKRRDGIILRRIQNELVLLDMQFQQIHQLNETATFIWDFWEQSADEAVIAKLLAHNFDVEEHIAMKDVSVIVGRLRKLNLLVN